MKALFIGGTGNISGAVSRLAVAQGFELSVLTRGRRGREAPGAERLEADVREAASVERALAGRHWDVVVDFIAFEPADIERDLGWFRGRTRQYIFISSASVYQKPPRQPVITESTPLENPYWEYSRNKIACERRLERARAEEDFPAVIVRPSLTYDTVLPVALGSWEDYTLVRRMQRGAPIVVHGDGTSLWTVTHADDFAKGLVGLFGNPQSIGHAFHITSDELLTWDQIYNEIGAAAGVTPQLVHLPSEFIARIEPGARGGLLGDKSHSVIFDNSKIKRMVPGYSATIGFAVGIRRTLAWFDADPARQRIDPENDRKLDALLAAAQTLL